MYGERALEIYNNIYIHILRICMYACGTTSAVSAVKSGPKPTVDLSEAGHRGEVSHRGVGNTHTKSG